MNDFLPIEKPHIEKVVASEDRVETILLVEDEAFVRNVTQEILQAAGYRVLTAGDGVGAQRLYDEFGSEVDLLLTDMTLPGGKRRRVGGADAAAESGAQSSVRYRISGSNRRY